MNRVIAASATESGSGSQIGARPFPTAIGPAEDVVFPEGSSSWGMAIAPDYQTSGPDSPGCCSFLVVQQPDLTISNLRWVPGNSDRVPVIGGE